MSSTGDDSTRARGLHRAHVVASVSHPNLVRLVPRAAGGYSCALDGAQRLNHFSGASAPFRRFELEHAVRLLLEVLNGLGALHDLVIDGRPFVHGCVSPEHICVDAHGQARLLPLPHRHFIVQAAYEQNGYAAPEWLLGSEVDRRADLFSVGVLLWEALAGRRLFPEPAPAVVLARLASGAVPPPPLPAGADWARALCSVAERALAAEPAHRPASAQELSRSILAAGGPRLTRPLTDDWHDEAPTLPAQRRPQQAPRRTFSPPGVVIDLSPAPKPEPDAPPVVLRGFAPALAFPAPAPLPALASSPPPAAPPAASSPRVSSPRAPHRPWLLGATAATYLALIGWLQAQRDAPSAPPMTVQAHKTTAAAVAAPAPALAALAVSAPASIGVPASLTRPASAASAAPPTTAPSVAPATPSAPLRSRRSAPARRLPPSLEPERIDYGI